MSDRGLEQLRAFVDGATAVQDFEALWPGQVSKQNSDGSVDFQCDSSAMPGFRFVALRCFPGIAVKVTAGARGVLGFENGLPDGKPFVFALDPGALQALLLGAGDPVGADVLDFVQLGTSAQAALNGLAAEMNQAVTTLQAALSPLAASVPTKSLPDVIAVLNGIFPALQAFCVSQLAALEGYSNDPKNPWLSTLVKVK